MGVNLDVVLNATRGTQAQILNVQLKTLVILNTSERAGKDFLSRRYTDFFPTRSEKGEKNGKMDMKL